MLSRMILRVTVKECPNDGAVGPATTAARPWPTPLPLNSAHDVAEPGGASAVGHFGGLAGLAFAAVDDSP